MFYYQLILILFTLNFSIPFNTVLAPDPNQLNRKTTVNKQVTVVNKSKNGQAAVVDISRIENI